MGLKLAPRCAPVVGLLITTYQGLLQLWTEGNFSRRTACDGAAHTRNNNPLSLFVHAMLRHLSSIPWGTILIRLQKGTQGGAVELLGSCPTTHSSKLNTKLAFWSSWQRKIRALVVQNGRDDAGMYQLASLRTPFMFHNKRHRLEEGSAVKRMRPASTSFSPAFLFAVFWQTIFCKLAKLGCLPLAYTHIWHKVV